MVNRFILNELSYFGAGARKELPAVVARLGFKKALVVTDKGLVKFGVCKMVTDVMDEAGILMDDMDKEETEEPAEEPINIGKAQTSLDMLDLDTLEDLLQEAIDNEDYQKAAEIRDEINRRK